MKFVYCIPRGGLNDSLNQIMLCVNYCKKFDRTLIIETNKYFTCYNDHLSNIFNFKNELGIETITKVDEFILNKVNKLSCHPKEVMGMIGNYEVTWYQPKFGIVEKNSKSLLSFNFENSYEEDVLIHDQSGGGEFSFELIKYLTFSENLKNEINKRICQLPKTYSAIHIRNTDYIAHDLENFLDKLKSKIKNDHIVVCSDNYETLKKVQIKFSNKDIIINNNIADLNGKPLHKIGAYIGIEGAKNQNKEQFIDLVSLANASELFVCKSETQNKTRVFISGFSKLAIFLNKNKKLIEDMLI